MTVVRVDLAYALMFAIDDDRIPQKDIVEATGINRETIRLMVKKARDERPAYEIALAEFKHTKWPAATQQRAARELASELTGRKDLATARTNADLRARFVDGLLRSLQAQSHPVTQTPIRRAVEAIVSQLVGEADA